MKHIYALIFCVASLPAFPQINGYTMIANYPLASNAADATGNYGDATLENAPFQDGGVLSNGVYNDGTNSGSIISFPNISAMNPNGFIVTCEYKIDHLPAIDKPILIVGSSWRWLGIFTYTNGIELHIVGNDGADVTGTGTATPVTVWVQMRITHDNGVTTLSIDGNDVGTLTYSAVHNSDFSFSCHHGGSGTNFEGGSET